MKWKSFILILLLQASVTSGKFIVTTPREPIVATVGSDVVLDCQLIPAEPPEAMEVRWFRSDWSSAVHLYSKGKDQPDSQISNYFGRTELFHGLFANGNVSLLLKKVTVKDDGIYTCFVVSKALDAEGKVELKVGKVGLEPVMKMSGYQGNGIKLTCVSDDWYPEPHIEWQSGKTEMLTGTLEKSTPDSRGLFKAESSLDVPNDSVNRYRCIIINTRLKRQLETNLQISGDFFPTVSGWLVAFWMIFVVLLGGIGVALFFYWKQRKQDMLVRMLNMRPTIAEYEGLTKKIIQEQAGAEKEKKKLLIQMENEKLAAKSEYDKLLHAIEWDKMLRCAVSVQLDPDTANGNLDVSVDQTTVKDGGGWRNVTENPKRFERFPFVTATEGFHAGKHYWEVDVGTSCNWDLGVAKESVQRKGRITLTDENGYWVIGRYWEKYEVKNSAKTEIQLSEEPTKIGIFLNYDEGIVSFHNANTKDLLYKFQTKFTEDIFPFFCPWRSQEPLKITPVTLEE
ncbi:butyrophilin subfamily 1 member A1-like [Heterodontus francisci]|uniref:butyrophilin subfamily 1 member A1-like n=1 Tax=Heterodontus francisci TaxID=7792 RepID=UPI00355AFEF1